MMKKNIELFTSESVTEGHPDKICDQISDAVLDECLRQDSNSRTAVETAAKNGTIWVFGEITTKGFVDVDKVTRNVLKKIGYSTTEFGIDYESCGVMSSIVPQSLDISIGVDSRKGDQKEQGAGDQGMMFGYACNETPEFMPMPIIFAHKLTKRLTDVRKSGILSNLGPDGKAQITVEYVKGKPKGIHTVVVSSQHINENKYSENELRTDIKKEVIKPVLKDMWNENIQIFINPTGKFVIGGPQADAGLTGRKIIVDTYGGMGRHGGGAFSGKDPSKVDRSATYAMRYIAKNIVAAGLADIFEVQISYSIGVAQPLSLWVNSFGTGKISNDKLIEIIKKHFPLKPADIISELDLKRPIYEKTATYGHFGRNDKDFTWEKLDKVGILNKYL